MLSRFSVRKPLTILVAVVVIIVFGCISIYKMTPDLFPSVDTPVVLVMTSYPGASPEEAETEITRPMEQSLATLANLEEINSVSGNNYSMIQMNFTDGIDMKAVSVDISQKIDQIKGVLPETAAAPVVMKMSMDIMPTIITAVEMGDKTPAEISRIVTDELMTPLEGTEGVATVTAMGLVDSDIQVVLSQEKIDKINDKIQNKIASEFDSASGQIQKGINEAKKGQKQIKQYTKQASKAGKQAIKELENTKKDLKNQKNELKKRRAQLNELLKQYRKFKDDPIQGQNVINTINAALKRYDLTVNDLEETVAGMDQQMAQIDQTLAMLDQADLSQIDIDKITGMVGGFAQGNIASTIGQLQANLEQLKQQKKAALSSADMDGILTMENIAAILKAQNFSMPAGYVSDGDDKILVSVGDKIKDKDELEDLILLDPDVDGIAPVRLGDIAKVTYGADDEETYAKVNGKNGICLAFTKQSTYATADVSKYINEKFEKLEGQHKGLHFINLYDGGEYIHMVINSVLESLLVGALLAMLILLVFLRDIRPTLITAVSIPLSVLFALVLMYFSGVTLNMVSMAGLAIGVGMLVDNSIVVVENTFRLRTMGYSRTQSAVSGAVQVAGAITASTLTTICVFVPIIFITGMTRDLFQDLALTVAYSLFASLLIALTLVPAMSKGMLKGDGSNAMLKQDGTVIKKYRQAAGWALRHKKLTVALAFLILIGSCGLALTKGFEFMPAMSTPQISADIQMPEGSTIDDTTVCCDEIEAEVLKIDGVQDVGIMLSSSTLGMLGMDAGTDVTDLTMYLMMDEDKLDQIPKVTKKLDELAEKYKCEIVTSADMDMSSMMGGSDISMTLYDDDLDRLREAGIAVEKELRQIKGLEEVSDVDEESSEELHIVVDKNAAMKKGLTVAQIFAQVSAKLEEETTATALTDDEGDIDVVIENTTKDKFTKDDLRKMKLTVQDAAGNKKKVKLTDIAEIVPDASMSEIRHSGQKRSLTVTAGVKKGYNITKMTSKVRKTIKDKNLIVAPTEIEYSGQNEEIMDSMKQMTLMLVIGFLLIYLVMVAQFQSLRSPFIIIFTVPLAFTGGMLALLLTGQTVSVVSMMGFVMLMGVIVNNGIVLVDCINRFRLEGMSMNEAIINAGAVRMRPVIMTALTTVLGLVPLAIGLGTGAEMMRPVALVCIGGLIYATVTTLLVVPIMYRIFARKKMVKIDEEELEIINV